jgi:Predicted signal transduction protein with a C-terminal ATPase domain
MLKNIQVKKAYFPFALRVFLVITALLIIPIYCMFLYINTSFSNYMDKEISAKVQQNISNSEQEISRKLENLINVSNLFSSDPEYASVMTDTGKSYYQKCKYFDTFVSKLTSSNVFSLNELKIAYFDASKEIYTNWGVNYNDYTSLLDQSWVKKSMNDKGYVTWNMFEPSYIQEEKGKSMRYISIAKPLTGGEQNTGTLIISMNENVLSSLLKNYTYSPKDGIFIYSKGTALNTISLDGVQPTEIQKALDKLSGSSGSFTDLLNNNKYIVSYYTLPKPWSYQNADLQVVAFIDYQNVAEETARYTMRITAFFLAFTGLMLVVIWIIIRTLVKPIKDLSGIVSEYQVGDMLACRYKHNDEIGQLYKSFEKMTINIEDLFYKLGDEYAVREKYRFESLRSQLNPHFIFNTLNSIRWMAIIKKQNNIVESIDAMTTMMQYSMGKGGDIVTLGQELESVNSYIYIQNMRYGERYEVNIDIPEELKACQTIKFSLQPIVENCIIHGFKDFSGKGIIHISGSVEEDKLILSVENNGNSITDDAIRKFEENRTVKKRDEKKVTGIGMTNVDEIIRITFGEGYGLHLLKHDGNTVVQYTLPYRVQEDGNDEKNNDC